MASNLAYLSRNGNDGDKIVLCGRVYMAYSRTRTGSSELVDTQTDGSSELVGTQTDAIEMVHESSQTHVTHLYRKNVLDLQPRAAQRRLDSIWEATKSICQPGNREITQLELAATYSMVLAYMKKRYKREFKASPDLYAEMYNNSIDAEDMADKKALEAQAALLMSDGIVQL